MAKIPFNIKFRPQIEGGEYKVEIGKSDPWSARIVCWDLNGNDLIVIVTNPEGKEEGLIYTPEGKHKAYAPRIDSDLFLVTPEPEMTEFEKAVRDVASYAISFSATEPDMPIAEFAKGYAPELLEMAKKELEGTPLNVPIISKDEREFLADEFKAFLSNYEKEFDDDAPLSDVAEHFFLCGTKWGEEKVMANLRENLANNDIFRIPQWLREALENAYQKGKNATTHA